MQYCEIMRIATGIILNWNRGVMYVYLKGIAQRNGVKLEEMVV